MRASASAHCVAEFGSKRTRMRTLNTYKNFPILSSPLHEFAPTTVLFAFDAAHVTAGIDVAQTSADADAILTDACERIRSCWRQAREAFRCPIIQQTLLPSAIPLLGSNEHKQPSSAVRLIERLNCWLREAADQEGVHLLALDARAAQDGLSAWYDRGLWYRSKQEVSPVTAPVYGDLVGRLLAALQGRSFKCLVLDLDNTLWGGVIGDDGLDGIVLGQGSPLGEAYVDVQRYARDLCKRGVILAVCSKNDEANALEPFDKHPEMVLRRGDISAFIANWNDKATNIREIAEALNIGLDLMVFFDDNPFERTLVRRELPAVAVPEIGEEPSRFAQILADAGYFEAVNITQEDRERTSLYQSNAAREASRKSATDLPSYLRSLDMKLHWSRFDRVGLQRIVQLINKTNQFNLTTRRYSEADVLSVMANNRAFGLQLRLIDRFGDNGIISIIIGKMNGGDDLLIDTWLMSCRVLGRQVEPTTLNLVAAQAQGLGARRLIGEYRPTKKNGMVREHYSRLGFTPLDTAEDGSSTSGPRPGDIHAGRDLHRRARGAMMSEAEIYAFLTDTFHDVFMRDDIVLKPELSAKDVEGWDSFKQIEILLATEERFGIKFSTREVDSLQNVGDLARLVAAKTSKA